MRILVIDDHPVLRQGIGLIISNHFPGVLIDEASSGRQALELIKEHTYDLIILDITFPDENGFDILKKIKTEKPRCEVLIMSCLPEESFAIRALKMGASGYLAKECTPEELIRAVETVMKGGRYMSPAMGEHLIIMIQSNNRTIPHERLSEREYQVMELLALGFRITEIAGRLSISVKTVSTHRARILQKMRLKSNAELTNYAVKNHLLKNAAAITPSPAG